MISRINYNQEVFMADFKMNMTVEQILGIMNKSDGHTETMHAGPCFLQYKLHQELMKDQQDFQRKQLNWTAGLAIATWILAFATIALALYTRTL